MHNRFVGITITFILACLPVQMMMCGSISAQTTLDRKEDIADRLLNQGFQQYEDKQYETALKSWQEALVLYREVKDVEGEYKAIQFLGLTYQLLGNHNKVIEYKLQQLLIMRQIRDIQDEDKVLGELGIAYLNIRNYGKSIQYLQQQLVTAKNLRKQDFNDKENILNNLSVAYYSLGIYAQSIDYKLQQLAIVRKKGDKQTEYKILEFLSSVYKMLGHSNRASDYNQQLLAIEKEMGNQTRVTVSDIETFDFTLMNSKKETQLGKLQSSLSELQSIKPPDLLDRIGSYISCRESSKPERCNLSDLGRSTSNNYYVNNQENIEFLKLRIREIEAKQRDGDELGRMGISSFAIGNYEKAIEYQLKWLNAAEEIENIHVKEVALTNLGIAYRNLGKYDTAINYLFQGLILARENKDKLRELKILGNLAIVYRDLHKYNEVIKYIRQGVELTRETVDKESNFTSLVNVRISFYSLCNYLKNQSLDYLKLGNYEKTIEYGLQHLEIAREIKDKQSEGEALDNLSVAYSFVGNYSKAINYAQQRLVIAREIRDRQGEAIALNNLGLALDKQNQIELAIFFYKQSINIRETIRQDLRELSKEDQKAYLDTIADSYRRLADLLLQRDRILEAQQVLDLLKVQEINDFLYSVRSNAKTERGIDNLPPEQQFNKGYQKLVDQAIEVSKKLAEIRSIKRSDRTIIQEQLIAQLDEKESLVLQYFNKFINSDEVQFLISKLDVTGKQQDILSRLSEFNALPDNLRNLQQDAVLLYPLILENRLELVLVTPYSPPIRRTVNVTSKELNQTIVEFRSALENPRTDATKPAQKLYDWLIKPIEKDLDTANTKTIIYAPDGQLRYIPLAALHDGKQWLTQRYRVNNITAASLTDLNTKPQRELSVLAGAYTTSGKKHNFAIGDEQFNFAGLPYAEMEVSKLAETIPDTTQLRDEGFSFKATKPKMDDYAIVHFATHAAFLKGQPEKSFILFGNGDRISLTDIKAGAFGSLKKVDLFVLSACETGVGGNFGTGAEILGFGYLMQTTGARAAIASLWKVNDSGTQALMNTFYATLANNAITKAEALRQSQIALITGDYKTVAGSRGQMVAIEQRIRQGLPNDVANNLSHPYYWASFILIGNGL